MNIVLLKESVHLIKRLYFACIFTATGRTKYINKHKKMFHFVGTHLFWQPRKLPPQTELISIGNNVSISSGVEFVTHDIISTMLNRRFCSGKFENYNAPIQIGNNVMIGANTLIMPNVKICDDVIIAAGSVITKDISISGVWGGVPAKRIKSFEDFIEKRSKIIIQNDVNLIWKDFDKLHTK